MTTNIEQFTSAGLDSIWWGKNNSTGYVHGTTGSIANGSDAAMARLLGAQSFGVQLQQPQRVNITGDDGVQSIFLFEPQELPSGDLVLGVFDVNLVAQSQGTNVYADGDHDVSVLQPEDFDFAELSLILNAQSKSRASGSSGEAGYMVMHLPKVQCIPMGPAGLANIQATNFTHQLIVSKSSLWAWGAALSTLNEGTTSAAIWGPVYSENRVTCHTFVGDGTTTNFTLGQTPAAADGSKIKVWKDGTALVYTTNYSVSGTTLTFQAGSIPAAGEIVVVRYEYT